MTYILTIVLMVAGKPVLPSATGPYTSRDACMADLNIQRDSFLRAGKRFVMNCEPVS